jgi:hypothetical protein
VNEISKQQFVVQYLQVLYLVYSLLWATTHRIKQSWSITRGCD